MEVFRYLTLEEILDYVNGRFDKIGRSFSRGEAHNTHRYKPDQKYVHFFKNIRDLETMQRFKGHDQEMLIAKFDIPFSTLVKHMGVGYYESRGYDTDRDTVREFAIPTSKLKEHYFVSCAKDKNGFMTPEEAIEKLLDFEKRLREHKAKQREMGEE